MDVDGLRPLAGRLLDEAQQMLDAFPRDDEMRAVTVSEVPMASFTEHDEAGRALWRGLHGLHATIVKLREGKCHPHELQEVMDAVEEMLEE